MALRIRRPARTNTFFGVVPPTQLVGFCQITNGQVNSKSNVLDAVTGLPLILPANAKVLDFQAEALATPTLPAGGTAATLTFLTAKTDADQTAGVTFVSGVTATTLTAVKSTSTHIQSGALKPIKIGTLPETVQIQVLGGILATGNFRVTIELVR